MLGFSLHTVSESKMRCGLTFVLALYSVAAVISGFGINGTTVDLYSEFTNAKTLIPGKGIPVGPIGRFRESEKPTELGSMYLNAVDCSDFRGDGLSLPLARLKSVNKTAYVCVDQEQYVLDNDMSKQREPEFQPLPKTCSFGYLTEVYPLPSEDGGPFDGSRIGLLYTKGDCNVDLNLTCSMSLRFGCAGIARIQDKNMLIVGNAVNKTRYAKEVLHLPDMDATRLERFRNEADFIRAVSQFYALAYSNSARQLSFLANLGPQNKTVRQRTGARVATEFGAVWFIGVAICLLIVLVLLILAVACRTAVISQGRQQYNSMVTIRDLLDAIEELLYNTGNSRFNKDRREELFFGIDTHRPRIRIKTDQQVGGWDEKEISQK